MVVNEKQIEYIVSVIERSGKTYDQISSGAGTSKSTISRLVKLKQCTKYTLDMLAAFFEVADKVAELGGSEGHTACPLVAGVSDELKRLEGIFGEREARHQAQCDERVAAISKQLEMAMTHHNQVVDRMQRNIDFLKEENDLLRAENKELISKHERIHADSASTVKKAEEQSGEIIKKKHFVYRATVAVSILLAVAVMVMAFALVVAFRTDAII